MAGGMDALRSQAKSFVENYYSRDEVAGVKAREIQDALKAVGITGDISTKDQFRALVEGVDVTTTQGQEQLATLLQAQGFLKNTEKLAVWKQYYADAINALKGEDASRMVDRNASRQESQT